VQLRHDQVLVVAGVTDQRRPVVADVTRSWLAGQVVVVALPGRPLGRRRGPAQAGDLPDLQLVAVGGVAGCRRAVQAVQLQAGGAQVLQLVADLVSPSGAMFAASSCAMLKELASSVMSWSMNWPK
jgi:DNA-binding transcriptional LysR family regulator